MRTNLLHHNDLHGDNVIVTKDNRIAIIDFGSAACGPTECLS
jgi:aminoglycoside phosphotransferase (APT) family kinase protein